MAEKQTVSALKEAADAPDPDCRATAFAILLLGAALVLAIVASSADWSRAPFTPAKLGEANFALFAGFYVATQLIERLLEIPALIFPTWKTTTLAAARADRAQIMLGVATVAGVVASFGFGLYFLDAIGIKAARSMDIFFSGLVIGAGTKPLHDLIGAIEKSASPTS